MNTPKTPIVGEVVAPPEVQIRAIRDLWDGMQESVLQQSLEIGRRLIALKAVYPDRWGRLFSDERRARSLGIQTLPFSQSKANVLMKISRHPVLTDSQHAANLPGDYTTLHTLSRLPEPDLKKAIKTGKVKPAMSRAEAGALVRKLAPQEAYSGRSRQSPTPQWVTSQHAPKAEPQVTDEHLNQEGNPFSAGAIYYVIRDQLKRIRYSDPKAEQYLLRILGEAEEILAKVRPASDDVPPVSDASTLNKKEQKALDKALTQLQAEFEQSVAAEVEKRLADARERKLQAAQQQAKSAQELRDVWKGRVDSCKAFLHLFQDNWRTVASSIHPDRPERTKEQLENASAAMNKLKSAFERIALDKWGSA